MAHISYKGKKNKAGIIATVQGKGSKSAAKGLAKRVNGKVTKGTRKVGNKPARVIYLIRRKK